MEGYVHLGRFGSSTRLECGAVFDNNQTAVPDAAGFLTRPASRLCPECVKIAQDIVASRRPRSLPHYTD